jgi:hypothetical protein
MSDIRLSQNLEMDRVYWVYDNIRETYISYGKYESKFPEYMKNGVAIQVPQGRKTFDVKNQKLSKRNR